jgi:hypothetical protein
MREELDLEEFQPIVFRYEIVITEEQEKTKR